MFAWLSQTHGTAGACAMIMRVDVAPRLGALVRVVDQLGVVDRLVDRRDRPAAASSSCSTG